MKVLPYLLFGGISVVFGTTVYYFLPYSLLTNSAALLLDIFFVILLGMILGLTLLAINLRGILEQILIIVLLFWEKKSMRTLIRKNLIAHKRTNKLTSVIYALSLGCIIFIIVAATLQIQEIQNLSIIEGVDLRLTTDYISYDDDGECDNCLYPSDADPVLLKYKDSIKSFGYHSLPIADF